MFERQLISYFFYVNHLPKRSHWCCQIKYGSYIMFTGILTEPTTSFQFGQEYIQATYVHFLEMAGARVVPVR